MSADVHALAGAYALNALPADEQAFFERHLAVCEACRAEVAELQETAAKLAAGTATAPPAALRASVLAAADVTRQLPPEPASPSAPARPAPRAAQRWLVPVAAGLALALMALTGVTINLNQRLNEVETAAGDAPSVAVVGVLGAPDLQTAELDMGTAAPGRFLYSPSLDRGVLVAHGMTALGARETYELWLIHDGTPVPAGVFRPDSAGAAIAEVSAPVRGAEQVAITVEPEGGSEAPTGDVVASAPLQG